jgi:hypothetical protein
MLFAARPRSLFERLDGRQRERTRARTTLRRMLAGEGHHRCKQTIGEASMIIKRCTRDFAYCSIDLLDGADLSVEHSS